MPGGIALTLESAEIGGGDGERAVVEELAYGLDRLADVAAELGGGVAQDMDAGGRETGQAEVAPEAVVEGGAGDAWGPAPACQSDSVGCMEARSLPTSPRDRRMAEGGTGEFTAAAHTALADVAVEGGGVVEGDIAGG